MLLVVSLAWTPAESQAESQAEKLAWTPAAAFPWLVGALLVVGAVPVAEALPVVGKLPAVGAVPIGELGSPAQPAEQLRAGG